MDFNYRLMVNVMYINGKPILHAVNEATSFQAAKFLTNLQAKTTWDTLRAMWVDIYAGSSNVIITDAGKSFVRAEFVANARIMAIEVEEVPVEAYNSIGKVERYHGPLKRAFEVISANLGNAITSDHVLQMAVKAVNDTAGPDGPVPILLVFGTYPRLLPSLPSFPSLIVRANAVRKAITEVRKHKAQRQIADALFLRNGPNVAKVKQLSLQSEIRI
jgi:hypothetical protein